MATERLRRARGLLARLLGVAAVGGLAWWLGDGERVTRALDAVAALGAWKAPAFLALQTAGVVLLVPSVVPTLAAGALFGFAGGLPLTVLGASCGAVCAFALGRTFARRPVARWVEGNRTATVLQRAATRRGWRIVALARLSPIFPFSIGNYAFGLSGLSARAYALGSALGTIPSNAVYVYVGSLGGSLAAAGAEGRARSPAEWALLVGGLAATLLLAVSLRRMAEGALAGEGVGG